MQQEPLIEKLKKALKEEGKTPEEIETIIESILKSASLLLFTNAMSAFTEEDIAAIDTSATEEEGNGKILSLYEERTGKKAKDEMSIFLDAAIKKYLEEMKKPESPSETS